MHVLVQWCVGRVVHVCLRVLLPCQIGHVGQLFLFHSSQDVNVHGQQLTQWQLVVGPVALVGPSHLVDLVVLVVHVVQLRSLFLAISLIFSQLPAVNFSLSFKVVQPTTANKGAASHESCRNQLVSIPP